MIEIFELEENHSALHADVDALPLSTPDEGGVRIADVGEDPVIKETVADPVGDLLFFARVVFLELDLGHLFDDLAKPVDLFTFTGYPDGADDLPIDFKGVIAAFERPRVLAVMVNEKLLQPFADQVGGTAVVVSNPRFGRAGQNDAVFIKKVELLLQDACQAVDDVLSQFCGNLHIGQPPSHRAMIMLYYSG